MTITIKIKTDNAAFGDCPSDRSTEVARIIQDWVDGSWQTRRLFDWNGNCVGSVTVKGSA